MHANSKHYDVILIGTGLGCLLTGSILAENGLKVLAIERSNGIGGCASFFCRKGYNFDTSLHLLDGFDEFDLKNRFLSIEKLKNHVEFVKVNELFRFFSNDIDVTMPSDTKAQEEILCKYFPEESRQIADLYRLFEAMRKESFNFFNEHNGQRSGKDLFSMIPNTFNNRNETLSSFLDSQFKSRHLKQLISANAHYFHNTPSELSLNFFLIGQSGYLKGQYYIKGGSRVLSDYLAKQITNHGGEILLNCEVKKIIVEGDQAKGVLSVNRKATSAEIDAHYAKFVVCGTSIPLLLESLVEDNHCKNLRKKVGHWKNSTSLISIYLGLNKIIQNSAYSTYFFDGDSSTDKWDSVFTEGHPKRVFGFTDYGHISSSINLTKPVATICTWDSISEWELLDNNSYKQMKNELTNNYIDRLSKVFPNIHDSIEVHEMATPKTIRRYINTPEGTPYGYAQTPSQSGLFRPHSRTEISNLYLASAWTMFGGGFTGSMISGYSCSQEIIRSLGN